VSERRRRILLYGLGVGLAAGLLFAGFGITVPPDPGTRLNGAALLANMGQIDEALEACARTLREHPDSLNARIYRATFLAMGERYDEALEAYDDALAHLDEDHEGLRRDLRIDRAGVLLAVGRQDAFDHELELLRREGAHRHAWLLEGHAAERREEWGAAVAAYRRGLDGASDDEHLRGRLWGALMRQGDALVAERRFEEARAVFDEACPLLEDRSRALLRAAEVRLAMEDHSGAIAVLRRAGPSTPGVAPLIFRGATGLLGQGREREALEALEGAWAVDPKGTVVLLRSEAAWSAQSGAPLVKRILSSDPGKDGARLTAPE
jgi:tetratricopeptide (TPR) repeat protein